MDDIWWNIPKKVAVTPLSILRKHATDLTEATKGVLQGDVHMQQQSHGQGAYLNLRIVVPSLNNFIYNVTVYNQPILLYPGSFFFNNAWRKVENADEFEIELREILSSEEIGKVVSSLAGQANDATISPT